MKRSNLRDAAENRGIWAMVVIIALLFILAAYGYLSGAWDKPLP